MNTRYLHKCIPLLASFGIAFVSTDTDGYVDFLYSNMALPDSLDYTRFLCAKCRLYITCKRRDAMGNISTGTRIP